VVQVKKEKMQRSAAAQHEQAQSQRLQVFLSLLALLVQQYKYGYLKRCSALLQRSTHEQAQSHRLQVSLSLLALLVQMQRSARAGTLPTVPGLTTQVSCYTSTTVQIRTLYGTQKQLAQQHVEMLRQREQLY
jgi:hypothetical protein